MNRLTRNLVVLALTLSLPALAASPCEQLLKDQIDWIRADVKTHKVNVTITALQSPSTAFFMNFELPTVIDEGCVQSQSGTTMYCTGDGLAGEGRLFTNYPASSCNALDYGNNQVRVAFLEPYGFATNGFSMTAVSPWAPTAAIAMADLECSNGLMYGFSGAMKYVIAFERLVYDPAQPK
jgi:hypothetical protein